MVSIECCPHCNSKDGYYVIITEEIRLEYTYSGPGSDGYAGTPAAVKASRNRCISCDKLIPVRLLT